MNILFICDEYPPFRSGGIGSVTKIIAECLASRGHSVKIAGYYTAMDETERHDVVNEIEVYRYNLGYRKGPLRSRLIMYLNKMGCSGWLIQKELVFFETNIEELIQRKKIDIVEIPDFYGFNVFRTKHKYKKYCVPTVLRVHGSISFLENLSGHKNEYAWMNDRNHFMRCDAVAAVSRFSQEYVHQNFPDVHFKNDVVIYNPLEDSFINESPHCENQTILFVGKLKETKGAFSLIKAFNIFAKTHPGWSLRLAGYGDVDIASQYVDNSTKDRVSFLGLCNREQLKLEITNCTFACVPSYFENFSMVALEIMGRRRALIYTNRTSGPEVIEDGVNGLLVDPEDIDNIVNAMCKMADDDDFRYRCAENAYSFVKKNFTLPHIVTQIELLYSNLLNK